MNNLKKVLALVVAVAMFASFGFVASAADFSDVASGANYADAVNLLSNLGLITGYEDGTFRPDNTITRAEVAAIMVRMLGMEDSAAQGATIFTDVAADNWASGYVNVAVAQGIVNGMGDGTFAPSAEVTYEQVVKMIVCALGYEPAATSNGGYPAGYLYQASKIGVTKGVAGTTGTAASRATVAKLVYNALEVELMDQSSFSTGLYGSIYNVQKGKTVLTEYLGLEKVDAVVVETYLSKHDYEDGDNKVGLIVTKNYKENTVDIDYDASRNVQYFVADGTDAATLLGYTVVAYVGENEDGNDAIFAIAEKSGKNSVTVIDVADIAGDENNKDFTRGAEDSGDEEEDEDSGVVTTLPTSGSVSYYKSSTAKNATTVTIDNTIFTKGVGTSNVYSKNLVVNGFNDSYVNNNDPVDLVNSADIDDITFLDNDGDGDFEFIFVNVYTSDAEEFVVDSVDLEDYYIEGVDNTGSIEIDIDNPDVLYTVIKDGKIADFADIAEGDVVTVLDNSNGVSVKTIYVSSTVVEGSVDEVDDDTFTIAGKDYKASAFSVRSGAIDSDSDEDRANGIAKISAGDEGVYYINYLGKIAYVDAVSSIAGADFVYIIDAAQKDGDFGDKSFLIKVVTAKGTVETLTLKSKKIKVHYDTDPATGADVSEENLTDEVVFNTYLQSFVDGAATDKATSATAIAKINTNAAGEVTEIYLPGAKNFKDNDNYINDADAEKKEFSEKKMTYGTIPVAANTVVFNIDTNERDTNGDIDYEEAVTATTLSNIFSDGTSYSFIAYGDDNFDEAKAIVTWDAKTGFDPEAPVMVVTAKKTVVSDDEETYRLEGIMGGSSVSVVVDPDEAGSADLIEKGNIIIFSKSTSGFAQNIYVLNESTKTGYSTVVNGVINKAGVEKITTDLEPATDTVVVAFGEITKKTNTRFQLNNNDGIDYAPAEDCRYVVVEKAANDITVKAASYSAVKQTTGTSTYYAFVKTTADDNDEVTDVVVFKGFN